MVPPVQKSFSVKLINLAAINLLVNVLLNRRRISKGSLEAKVPGDIDQDYQ